MGRIEKMKRLIIEEANKRLLGEEKVVKGSSPIILGFLRIDELTVDTLTSKGGGTTIKISFRGDRMLDNYTDTSENDWMKTISFEENFPTPDGGSRTQTVYTSCDGSEMMMLVSIVLNIYEEGGKEFIKLEDLSVVWKPYPPRSSRNLEKEGIDCLSIFEGMVREGLQLDTPKELKTSDINDIARDYATKSGEIEGSNILISEVSELRNLLQRNDVTGLTGWMQRLVGKGEGFVGADLKLKNAQQVSNIAKFLEARMVQALLDEKGKTISDADRKLIKDLLGDIESATSNRATILDKLELIETTLRKSKTDSERYLKFYDAEYGDLIPNLSVFRKGTPESPVEEETEVQVTQEDVEDVID